MKASPQPPERGGYGAVGGSSSEMHVETVTHNLTSREQDPMEDNAMAENLA